MINIVTDFLAVPDGNTDNTCAIQDALDAGRNCKTSVFIPSGVFRAGNLLFHEKQRILGEGETQAILKPMPGTTGVFLSSDGNTNDIKFEGWGIDGGFGEGSGAVATCCDTLVVDGSRPTIRDFTIVNSAGRSLHTKFTANDRLYSILGRFERITIDKSQKDGWKNDGPNDSYVNQVEIVDSGLGENNAYLGYVSEGMGTVRADNMHIWNRTPTGNHPYAGAFIDNKMSYFSNCQFESGTTSLIVNGIYNHFINSQYYAPDGGVAVRLFGSWNTIHGTVGAGHDLFYPDFMGVVIGDAATGPSSGNKIDIMDGGCNHGTVDMTHSGGNNRVIVRGWKNMTYPTIVGTPKLTDIVDARMN